MMYLLIIYLSVGKMRTCSHTTVKGITRLLYLNMNGEHGRQMKIAYTIKSKHIK